MLPTVAKMALHIIENARLLCQYYLNIVLLRLWHREVPLPTFASEHVPGPGTPFRDPFDAIVIGISRGPGESRKTVKSPDIGARGRSFHALRAIPSV